MLDHSEEQQPLENFFRAKGIKTKNEMADDVSASPSYPHDCTNAFNSRQQFLQLHFKTTISPRVTMGVSQIAVVPTRTTRALMKISTPSLNLKSEKNSTPTTTVAPATAMPKWKMQVATQVGKMRNDRRRSRRPRTERLRQPPRNVAQQCRVLRNGPKAVREPSITRTFQNPSKFRCAACTFISSR